MSATQSKPALFKIIKNDYPSFLAIIFPLVCLAGIIFVLVMGYLPMNRGREDFGPEILPFLYGIGGLSLLICIPILVWRVRLIQTVFTTGQEVKGVVTSLFFHKDRGRIEYQYIFKEAQYQSGNAIMKNQQTLALVPGTAIVLMVNPANPQQAFIRDFYL